MVSRHRFVLMVVLLFGLIGAVTGCVRPTPDDSAGTTPTAVAAPDLSDPNVGGGVTGDELPTLPPPTMAAYPGSTEGAAPEMTQPAGETAVTMEATTALTETVSAPAATTPTAETATGAESAEATAVPTVAAAAAPTGQPATGQPAASGATGEILHVVQPGENLFRIGLQYGISWVTLAQYNGLSNPNDIRAGQTLRIPATGTTPPTVTPVPPGNITYYTVQPGDNLFRIGLKFGVSWVQIAEANGLVNPNQIYAGQTLKIPVNAPGPTPEFTHVVKQGETIFRIAVQYGVPWLSIAEANNIQSPYIIYPGQTLVIPGS